MKSDIEKNVMASVGAIYFGRRLTSGAALRLYVVGISLVGIASFVSVPHVLTNLLHAGPAGFPLFALSALEHTTLLVQAGIAACLIVALSFVGESLRGVRGIRRTA